MTKNLPKSTHHLNYSSSFNKLNPISSSINKISKNNNHFRNPLQIKFDLNINNENNVDKNNIKIIKSNIKNNDEMYEDDLNEDDSIEMYNPECDWKNGEYMYSPNNSVESLGSIELNNGEKKDLHNDSLNYNIEDLINYKENIIDQNEYKYNYQIIQDLMRMKNNWDNDEEDDE